MAHGFAYQACEEHKEWMEPNFESTDLREGHIQQFIAHDKTDARLRRCALALRARAGCARGCRHNSNDGSVTLKYIVYKLCEHGARTIGEFQTRQAALKKQNELLALQRVQQNVS